MQTLKSFLDQAMLIWKDSTAAARIGLALLLILCVGSIVGIGVWSAQLNYVNLAIDLQPEQAGKVIDALESANIRYQVKGTGSIIAVDSRNLSRAQIAAQRAGIGKSSLNLEEVTPWMDPLNQQTIFHRNQERSLVQTIEMFPSVSKAKVHLNIPPKQHFIRHTDLPSASVLLEIAPDAKFGDTQAASLARLVANSVAGLTPDRVAISDNFGNEFATDESMGRLSKQDEYRVLRDRELSQKAESMLATFLGFGNARVEVSTDFTFTDGTIEITEVDPDKKVVIDETINSSEVTGDRVAPVPGGTGAGGAVGTGPNVSNTAARSSPTVVVTKTEDLTNKYEASRTVRNESSSTPVMNMLSVSVIVNSKVIKDNLDEMLPKIQATVQQAVGFRDTKDQISVEHFEFIEPLPAEAPAFAVPWEQINQILKNLSLGIAAIIAFFVARKAFKRLQPDPSFSPDLATRKTQVDQLSELVQQNPEVFSKIISSWSNLDSNDPANDQPQDQANNARKAA